MSLTPTRTTLVALATVVPLLAGCAGGGVGYESLGVQEWKAEYESTPGAFLLDVRTVAEYEEAHVANATLIPFDEVAARANELPADKETPIFVYCRSGNRSGQASATLVDLGYTNVVNLDGGLVDWMSAGFPVESGSPQA